MGVPRDELQTVDVAEEELAAALDQLIEARRAGRAADCSAVLARYPQLADAVDALAQLRGDAAPVADDVPASSSPAFPAQIGPYRIESELGSGGFGVVYKAYDPNLQRPVALKVLHPGRLDQQEALERFLREARATARLEHPGIVRLHDYSREGPPYYLATQYLAGADLQDWCRRHGPTWAEVAALVARVAEAIDHAHAHGICHRDLKPANILVDEHGEPHVLDFGLARLNVEAAETTAKQTSDGRILGTLAYMSPEQAAGHSHEADARTDVYSLGVILYELLTGRQPFQGPSHLLPARVIEGEAPNPRRLRAAIPRDLEAVCLKAMARRPEDRYGSAAALAGDLRAFLRGEAVEARPLTWVSRLQKVLARRHQDAVQYDWSAVLVLEGLTILAGCSLVFFLENWDATRGLWWPFVAAKVAQFAVMLYVVIRLRPDSETGQTAVERQIRALLPAYLAGFLTLVAVRHALGLEALLPLAPLLAVLSGMIFVTLGATIWGWFYALAAGFFGLALATAVYPHFGQLLLGVGWFVCLSVSGLQMRGRRSPKKEQPGFIEKPGCKG